jgi:hypothetical protein
MDEIRVFGCGAYLAWVADGYVHLSYVEGGAWTSMGLFEHDKVRCVEYPFGNGKSLTVYPCGRMMFSL